MGILDKNPLEVKIIKEQNPLIKKIGNIGKYTACKYMYEAHEGKTLGAVYGKTFVFFNSKNIYISTNGIDGEQKGIELTSDNFPELIDGSKVQDVMIIPYNRNNNSIPFSSGNYRIVVITNHAQIYHNYPARGVSDEGNSIAGDEYLFDESVVWDLPERKTPVKSTTGIDSELISTGCYRYIPCLEDDMYVMYPSINRNNGYGNKGFGATIEYKDRFSNKSVRRPRFFNGKRDNVELNPFRYLSGYTQDKQINMVGTYQYNEIVSGRTCVFSTTDGGRQWFVQYEFGTYSTLKKKVNTGYYSNIPWNVFHTEKISWDGHSIGSGILSVQERIQIVPSTDEKSPQHKFGYSDPINVSSVNGTNDAIIVTTTTEHNLKNGSVIVFTKSDNSDFDWLCSSGFTEDSCGDGNIWKVELINNTSFKLRLEIRNPNNNISARHIHTLNRIKDGYIIGCGEEYPFGWIILIKIDGADDYSNIQAWHSYPYYLLTNTENSLQRILGMTFSNDGKWIAGLDTSNLLEKKITLPNGEEITRNSVGIYSGDIESLDDFSKAICILDVQEPAFFFKSIFGVLIFVGQRGLVAISEDEGNHWEQLDGGYDIRQSCQLVGVDENGAIYIKNIGVNKNTLILLR